MMISVDGRWIETGVLGDGGGIYRIAMSSQFW